MGSKMSSKGTRGQVNEGRWSLIIGENDRHFHIYKIKL